MAMPAAGAMASPKLGRDGEPATRGRPSITHSARCGMARRLPLLVVLLLPPCPVAGTKPLGFAKCDASKIEQQWCVTSDGEIRDIWGRCLTRANCDITSMAGVNVLVDNCGSLTAGCGGQHWEFDKERWPRPPLPGCSAF